MKLSILKLSVIAALLATPVAVYSQSSDTASILPPAKTTFFDNNGKPLAAGTVDFYVPGTATRKTTWQDAGETVANTNPVVLDNAGRALILGGGSYRQVVKDKNGNLIWDQVTSSAGAGGGGGGTPTVGDGDPVGIIKPWAGFIAPYGYVFAYGQEFVRTSYPEAFQALTSQQSVTCSTGSATLTGVGDTSQLPIGAAIESACLNSGATVVSKTISTVVASSVAIISTTSTARFFPYGNGDGSVTFNLPDLRGYTIAGRDNMGGIAASKLTSTYFGTNPSAIGAKGGTESQTLTLAQLPSASLTVNIPSGQGSHTHSVSGGIYGGTTTDNFSLNDVGAPRGGSLITINSATLPAMTGTANLNGSGQGHSLIQPTQTLNYIIKVIPDSNPNTFFGVASIGGMYGVLECGAGITCAGNTISATSSVVLPPPTATDLGGVYSLTCSTSNWFNTLDVTGAFGCSQPDFSDITGVASVAQGGTGNNSFTSNLPLIGNGTSAIAQGTVSGNTTKFATVSGTIPFGNCVTSDANGNLIDFGSSCSGGGGSSSAVAFPTRTAAIAASIPVSVNTIFVNGYTIANDGGAGRYNRLLSTPSPVKAWHIQTADGSYWQLAAKPVFPKQLGAILNGSTDDTTAIQAWLDYASLFGVTAMGQTGQAIVPTASVNIPSNVVIDMANSMTITRTTDTVAGLFECNSASNITITNSKFSTTAGFSSTTSAAMGLGSKNFTVPAGLVGLVVNQYVQITANNSASSRVNYEIARINSYSGTTLNVTATTSVGSGTFNNWLIDVYPINGNLNESNIAIYARSCTNFRVSNSSVSGRFYNAYDSRNGTDIYFRDNVASGYVNRGIHAAAYNSGFGAQNNQIVGNRLTGGNFAQYGVNVSASDGAAASGFNVEGNNISGTTFQGIIFAGGLNGSSVRGNTITMAFPTNGVGIIVESLTGSSGNQIPQRNTFTGNTINSGLVGIYGLNIFYSTFTANTIVGSGTCFWLQGSSTQQTLYNTVTGNTANSCTSHGFYFSGSSANGVFGTAVTGNMSISNGGWGFISDANTGSGNYGGNIAIANTAGTYSLSGSGNVTTGGNL